MKIIKSSKLKVQNYNSISKKSHTTSKFKIIFWLSLILTLHFGLLTFNLSRVNAQSPTPESTPTEVTPTIDPTIQEKVEERIQKVLTTQTGKKRALVGKIAEITNSTLVLETKQGEKQTITNEETKIVDQKREKIEFENLEIGSFIIVMGYLQDSGILEARRLVISQKPKAQTRLVAFGKVTDISSGEEKILKVKHPKKETVYTVEVTKETKKITKKVEGKIEEVEFDEIEIDDRLVAIGSPDEEENFLTAKIIHVIPGKATGLSPKSTEEEEQSPSPSPSPIATPTPSE